MEKANMKKALLYVSVAVMLGVGIMLFPLWTFLRGYGEPGLKPMWASENWPEYQARSEGFPTSGDSNVQVQSKSTDASLQMLTIGFIAALVVYVVARRKSTRPTYLPTTFRFPPS